MWRDWGPEAHMALSSPPFHPDDNDWDEDDAKWAVLLGLFGDRDDDEEEEE